MTTNPVQWSEAEYAAVLEWRCVCAVIPLLGFYTTTGTVHLKLASRLRRPLHYILDVRESYARAHCAACHQWRELYYDRTTNETRERQFLGPRPAIDCPVCGPDADGRLLTVDAGPAAQAGNGSASTPAVRR